jgi:hypothetical protein
MMIESIHRIGITAMVLLLVLAAAAAQRTNTPLYVDGVHRVVATLHRINEGSLLVNGSMESFGYSVYPSWPQDTQRMRTILQSMVQARSSQPFSMAYLVQLGFAIADRGRFSPNGMTSR